MSAGELALPEPDETGKTFVANARIKAEAAANAIDKPALADDSGLVIPALKGAPGLLSARWGGPTRDFGMAMQRIEDALAGKSDRRAYFVCALALAWPDGYTELFEGQVHGQVVWPPRGDNGFGYDPIFLAEGHKQTFGEMDPTLKHGISHRAAAFAKLVAACFRR